MAKPASRHQRGLGWDHDKARKRTPKPNGDPCPFCGGVMFADMPLDFDHAVPRALGGDASSGRWAHRRCNRRAGAILGNKLRRRSATRLRW